MTTWLVACWMVFALSWSLALDARPLTRWLSSRVVGALCVAAPQKPVPLQRSSRLPKGDVGQAANPSSESPPSLITPRVYGSFIWAGRTRVEARDKGTPSPRCAESATLDAMAYDQAVLQPVGELKREVVIALGSTPKNAIRSGDSQARSRPA